MVDEPLTLEQKQTAALASLAQIVKLKGETDPQRIADAVSWHIDKLDQLSSRLRKYILDGRETVSTTPAKDTAYVKMVDNCVALGLTPLSPEEFAKEDKRMTVDIVRRRNGLDKPTPLAFGSYTNPCAAGVRWPRDRFQLRWQMFTRAFLNLFRS